MNWLRRFMTGRYGGDELCIALIVLDLILWLIGAITDLWIFSLLSFVCCIIAIWRMMSKKIYQRQKENRVFMQYWSPIQRGFAQWLFRRKDRTHRYIRCKKCKERLRLPRGKGRIEVTCPKCRERFLTKT